MLTLLFGKTFITVHRQVHSLLHGLITIFTWSGLKMNPSPRIVTKIGSPDVKTISLVNWVNTGLGWRFRVVLSSRREVTPSIRRPIRSGREVWLNLLLLRRGAVQYIVSAFSTKQGCGRQEIEDKKHIENSSALSLVIIILTKF